MRFAPILLCAAAASLAAVRVEPYAPLQPTLTISPAPLDEGRISDLWTATARDTRGRRVTRAAIAWRALDTGCVSILSPASPSTRITMPTSRCADDTVRIEARWNRTTAPRVVAETALALIRSLCDSLVTGYSIQPSADSVTVYVQQRQPRAGPTRPLAAYCLPRGSVVVPT